jgi:hypothetical protein
MRTRTEERTHETYRENADGTETVLRSTIYLTVTGRHRRADEVTGVDYDADGYDADDNPHPLTEDERETLAMAASDAASGAQVSFDDRAEAEAEDAWDARMDR